MNLYDIDHRLLLLYSKIEEAEGEIDDVTALELDALEMAFDQKVQNIALYHKTLLAEAKAIKEERERLYERQKQKEKRADNLKQYLRNVLDGKKMEGNNFAIGWRKSEVIPESITEENAPSEFIKTKIEKSVDKAGLKKAIKEGLITYIKLEQRNNIQIK